MPNAAQYHANRAECLLKKKIYDSRNKAKISAREKARYAANRDKILARVKRYQADHREQSIARTRKWHQENAARGAANKRHANSLRRARKYGTQIDPAGIKAWMREIRSNPFTRCHWCGTKVSGKKIQFDHVVALSRGGTHTIGNLCASCYECNQAKKNKLLMDWVCGGQTFLKL